MATFFYVVLTKAALAGMRISTPGTTPSTCLTA